jgi:hypothetical protein
MSKHQGIWSFLLLLLALNPAWAQDSSAQLPAETPPDTNPQQPIPAYGAENGAPSISENPPISGLDMPNLEPHAAPLSYLQAGAHVSASADSNIQDTLGGSGVSSSSRAMGSLDLRRLWRNYDLALDYLGGVGYYEAAGIGFKQVQELGVNQRITWKRGEFSIRDAFSYQPDGGFGSSYGAVGSTGAGLAGTSVFLGASGLGSLGQVPRVSNISLMDAVESLTPKSSITVTGGYAFLHFLGEEPGTTTSFIGSSQVSGEVGYNRVLGPHDQGALAYGYQSFYFPSGVNFHGQVIQLMWGHRISGRMDLLISVGPQFTQINNLFAPVSSLPANPGACELVGTFPDLVPECPTSDLRISAAGRASLRYQFPKVRVSLTYDHYLSSGSGFFYGSETDIVRLAASRQLGRVWAAFSDIGYTRNARVLPFVCPADETNCPGVSANTYQYIYAGFGVHRRLGRNFHAVISYQFNNLIFDGSYCQATIGPCNRISQQNVGTVGLDWTPRPIRLD